MLFPSEGTLSDYFLAVECAVFATLIGRRDGALRTLFVLFFGGIGLAAALGGIAHSFFSQAGEPAHRWVWEGILAALTIAVGAAAWIGAQIFFSKRQACRGAAAGAVGLALSGAAVLSSTHSFFAAILFFLPPVIFLLAAFFLVYWRTGAAALWPGIAGLVLSAIATAAELGHHHTFYHLLQAIALLLLFWTARRWVI